MSKRILVVEDEPDILSAIEFGLKKTGYEVITAADGKDGFAKAKKENPNLIILDLMLPLVDGYKICSLLKADKRYKDIPIIIFTALTQESDKQMGKEAKADAYITKPFKFDILLAKIKELLKES